MTNNNSNRSNKNNRGPNRSGSNKKRTGGGRSNRGGPRREANGNGAGGGSRTSRNFRDGGGRTQYSNNGNARALAMFEVHPTSFKMIKQGHFWITLDEYSELFHPNERFVVATRDNRPCGLLLHDPTHKQIRARVWSTGGNFQQQIKDFRQDIGVRIRQSIKKRHQQKIIEKRDHFYLVFGEADSLPGVVVHYLNGEVLIQFYMDFWKHYQEIVILNVLKHTSEIFGKEITFENLWTQFRSEDKTIAKSSAMNVSYKKVTLTEYGVKYQAVIGKQYDHGIYTDMAAIRYSLKEQLEKSESVLNLFSYTGAFSLFAMKCGAKKVVSVDLSENYIQWLEKNIAINEDLDSSTHTSMTMPTKSALKKLVADGAEFDMIISDPPSSSSDGQKRTNALADYSEILPYLNQLITQDGKALIFLNTHKVNFRKYEEKIIQIIRTKGLNLKIDKKINMGEDCPSIKGFHEGSYLKGLLLSRKSTMSKKEIKEKAQDLDTVTDIDDFDEDSVNNGNKIAPKRTFSEGNRSFKAKPGNNSGNGNGNGNNRGKRPNRNPNAKKRPQNRKPAPKKKQED